MEKKYSINPRVGSIHEKRDLAQALAYVKEGYGVGIYNRGVCALWGNGADERFWQEVIRIKGDPRSKKPLALTIKTEFLIPHIDFEHVDPGLHEILKSSEDLTARIGSLCFIRIPIKKNSARLLPPHVLSQDNGIHFVQNWDAYGHDPVEQFLDLLEKNNIRYPSVTSLNKSGRREIIDQQEGEKFAREKGVRLFLADEKDTGIARGSFTIIAMGKEGVSLVRDGNVPGEVFSYLLETTVDRQNAASSHFAQNKLPTSFFELPPYKMREAIISHLYQIKSSI